MRRSNPAIREAQLWLLEHLGTEPRLRSELVAEAEAAGIAEKHLEQANRKLPILHRPRELRGPGVWFFPDDDQQVLVRYRCPLAECSLAREGWMPFGATRPLFRAGLLSYQVRGRVQRTRPPEAKGYLLGIEASPPGL